MATKRNSLCRKCSVSGKRNGFYNKQHTNNSKINISNKRKGQHNSQTTQFGGENFKRNHKSNYEYWLNKYGKEEADKRLQQSNIKKSIAASGENNPMYNKIAPQGSGNGWSGWYKNFYFRSLYELSYIYYLFENNINFVSAESKKFSILYIDIIGKKRTYRPDYFIENNILVECKPKKLHDTPNNKIKFEAAKIFCKNNNYQFIIVEPVKLSTEQILNLFNNKEIIFIKRYEEKFKKLFLC